MIPAPYGKQRPRTTRASIEASASAASRDLPIPGSPTTVTSSQRRSATARCPRFREQPELALAADERESCRRSGAAWAASSRNAATGSAFPFSTSGSTGSASTAPLHELERRRADQHLARRRRLLEPRRHVHRVPGRQPLRRARSPPHRCSPRSDPRSRARQRIPHLDRRPTGPQRVVLVHHRHPEHRHHRIPDELLHRPAVRLDDPAHPLEIARQATPATPPDPSTPRAPSSRPRRRTAPSPSCGPHATGRGRNERRTTLHAEPCLVRDSRDRNSRRPPPVGEPVVVEQDAARRDGHGDRDRGRSRRGAGRRVAGQDERRRGVEGRRGRGVPARERRPETRRRRGRTPAAPGRRGP